MTDMVCLLLDITPRIHY